MQLISLHSLSLVKRLNIGGWYQRGRRPVAHTSRLTHNKLLRFFVIWGPSDFSSALLQLSICAYLTLHCHSFCPRCGLFMQSPPAKVLVAYTSNYSSNLSCAACVQPPSTRALQLTQSRQFAKSDTLALASLHRACLYSYVIVRDCLLNLEQSPSQAPPTLSFGSPQPVASQVSSAFLVFTAASAFLFSFIHSLVSSTVPSFLPLFSLMQLTLFI